MTAPRYLSARRVARELGVPWRDLEPALERTGVRILRIRLPGGGTRVRVEEESYRRYLAEASRRELSQGDRAELAVALTLEEAGIQPRRRRGELTP